jgi:hypothetical protein
VPGATHAKVKLHRDCDVMKLGKPLGGARSEIQCVWRDNNADHHVYYVTHALDILCHGSGIRSCQTGEQRAVSSEQ